MRTLVRTNVRNLIAGLLAYIACVAPASALPGQTLQQFHAWASSRKLLAGIAQRRDEMSGDPAFGLETSDRGIAWTFYATTDGSHVRRESLSLGNPGKPPGSAAIRHDGSGYGFTFFTSLYGQAVAHDFLVATRVASIRDRSNGTVTEFTEASDMDTRPTAASSSRRSPHSESTSRKPSDARNSPSSVANRSPSAGPGKGA